TANNG
ncbi:disulfide interchange protein DsbD, partial [Vibrio parahaemolyticus V-223/04]